MENKEYMKKCLGRCGGNEIKFTNEYALNNSIKNNSLCKSCAKKQYFTDDIRKKYSERYKKRYNDPNERKKQSERLIEYYEKSDEKTKKNRIELIKSSYTDDVKKGMSDFQTKRFSNIEERRKNSEAIKIAMHRPDVRKKHREAIKIALHRPDTRKRHLETMAKVNFLGNSMDIGCKELLEKWNRLGFKFEPNYQIHTDVDLFYIDGYDKEKNVVIEYDSKYHSRLGQKEKDLVRQNKIINILNPTKFWRYNSVNKSFKNVLLKGN